MNFAAGDDAGQGIDQGISLTQNPSMAFLTRTDPTKNMHRYYVVHLAPTLFGDWTLWREWGRSGSPGTVRLASFGQYDDAQKAEQRTIKRRLNHGYIERAA
jgi:predicted DNA-binding WGR domain protein